MIFYAAAFLFFLQLLTSFVAANYAFGLLQTGAPIESVSALLLLAPFLLLLRPRFSPRFVVGLFAVVAATRLALPIVGDPRVLVFLAGAGVGASLLLLPLLFWHDRHGDLPSSLTKGLAVAVAALIAFRLMGSGVDISMSGVGQVVVWPLALLAVLRRPGIGVPREEQPGGAGGGSVAAACLGLTAALALVYSAFSAPNVIAGWSGESYLLLAGLTLGALLAWSAVSPVALLPARMKHPALLSAAALFGVLLVLALFGLQLGLPSDPAAYPLAEAAAPWWSRAALFAGLLLWPLTLVAFQAIAGGLQALQPSARQMGLGFGLGAVFLAIVIFAQIFTTTYDYVPLGDAFRDRFWLVFAVPVACLLAALVLVRGQRLVAPPRDASLSLGLAGLALLALGSGVYLQAGPDAPPAGDSLTVIAYNVQQGYDVNGRRNFDGQLALLRRYDPGIIGLSESETNRVANGNDDLVRYFARKLNMHSYSGPRTVTGTFGIALLSRYPIVEPRTYYLYSEREQTAVIAAKLDLDGRLVDVLVAHLGPEGPLVQQQAVLELASRAPVVILMGDFNFRPDSEQYRLTVELLVDAWAKRWPPGAGTDGVDRPERIDHVFVAPALEVVEAEFIDSPASDHPALVVELGW